MITCVSFVALLVLGTVCSWLGCLVPYAAIAAAAAVNLRAREGALIVGVTWALDQAIGFGVHHYPHAAATYAWGAAIGAASFAAWAVARMGRRRPLLALLAAFATFELTLAAFSLVLGGWNAYAPSTVALLLVANGAWFAIAQAATSLALRRPILRGIV